MTSKEIVRDASVDTVTGQEIGGAGQVPYFEGDDATFVFVCTTQDGKPLDLSQSGEVVGFDATDGNNTIDKDTGGADMTLANASAGVVEVTINEADTSGIDSTTLNYTLTLTDDGSGNQTTLAEGQWSVSGSEEN